MRTPKMLMIGLLLAGLTGCGPASAAEDQPSWVAGTAGASPSAPAADPPEDEPANEEPSEEPAAGGSAETPENQPEEPEQPEQPEQPAVEPSGAPGHNTAGDPVTPPKQPGPRRGGPANSLTKTGVKGVALTFDDGPDPVQTPKLLDLLAEHGVKATFCLVGKNVVAHPGLVRRIAAEGHTLCNHTWRHDLTLGKKKPRAIRADLARTNDAIRQAVPGAQIKYMRAPGGNFTDNFVSVAAGLGMASIYWQVDPRDWDHPAGETPEAHVAKVVKGVQKHVRRGSIVLSHDYQQPDTIIAYQELIPWLQERYKLIALP
jgi:peptidoglycan/xylan/chitin deacetylase (PgdA/CDA1 family)